MGKETDSLWLPVLCCCIWIILLSKYSIAVDTITPTQSINGNQTIVSLGQKFELGFFRPSDSGNRYLGIWYKNIPVPTVVWVANRDNPLTDSSGNLTIGEDGNLVLFNQTGSIVWSSNSSRAATTPVAQLLDSGNLVLRDGNSENYLWQAFDYPSNTLLPGMKLGWNLRAGLNRHLRSWKTADDPSSGDYTYSVDIRGLPQLVLHKGPVVEYRSRPWYGGQFSGGPVWAINPVFRPMFVSNSDEVYYTYETIDNITSRFVLGQTGLVQHFSWNDRHSIWNHIATVQEDRCDDYAVCGSYGICNFNNSIICKCLKGFEPRSPQDWQVLDWTSGCARKDLNVCRNGERFTKVAGIKLPDAKQLLVNVNLSLEQCEVECLKNCSCMAYARLDFSGSGSGSASAKGCITWFGDLTDIREVDDYGQDLYVRMAASELGLNDGGNNHKNNVIAVVLSVVSAMIILALISWFLIWKKRKEKASQPDNQVNNWTVESRGTDLELPLFELNTIKAATNNLSSENKIGEGGFGPVYKGVLPSGQELAIKRLSENSGQGIQEFKNEVIFISKLQHRNLVRILGCCIEGQERMLIYEYMQNRSLDSIIFDETRRPLLNWQMRFDIVIGIARGLVYLHRDSRLRIIHRDLKASNVLLDTQMNPKISDFGMARMFGGDQTEANTKRVVGTYGYMSPEYAIDGQFSMKSDVFSFGVLLLEIVSGNKNRGFFHPDHKLNLLGHAWKLWNEGKALELVDALLHNEFPVAEARRCIQVGLLCVQQRPEERPTMPSVLLMLDSESALLPQPGRPGFYEERFLSETESSSVGKVVSILSNEMSVTLLEGR